MVTRVDAEWLSCKNLQVSGRTLQGDASPCKFFFQKLASSYKITIRLASSYKLTIRLTSSDKLTIRLASSYKLTIFCKKLAKSYKLTIFCKKLASSYKLTIRSQPGNWKFSAFLLKEKEKDRKFWNIEWNVQNDSFFTN